MLERNSDIIQMEIHCLAQLLNECCQRPYWHYHNKAGEVLPSNVDIVQGAYFKNGSLSFINYKSFQRMLNLIPEGLKVFARNRSFRDKCSPMRQNGGTLRQLKGP